MTNEEKIKYLMQYNKLYNEIQLIKNSFELYYDKLYSAPTPILSNMPKSSNKIFDKIGIDVANLEKLRKAQVQRINKLNQIRNDIQQKIWELPNSMDRIVMTLRYLDNQHWNEIALRLNYSKIQVQRFHLRALININL